MPTSTATRDSQRSQVYAAEQEFRRILDRQFQFPTITLVGSTISVPIERKFADINSIQRYVDSITSESELKVRLRKSDSHAHQQFREIAIPMMRQANGQMPWAAREIVVLHEVSHYLSPGAQHGPDFTEAFVNLVLQQMGPEAAFLLRVLFHQEGVR